MAEQWKRCVVNKIRMRCEDCGQGEMISENEDGVTLSTYPPQYPHKCNKCGATRNYTQLYPYYDFVEVGTDWNDFYNTGEPDKYLDEKELEAIKKEIFEEIDACDIPYSEYAKGARDRLAKTLYILDRHTR